MRPAKRGEGKSDQEKGHVAENKCGDGQGTMGKEAELKVRKRLTGISIAAAMAILPVFHSWAGEWKLDGGRYWYQNDDGSYIKYDIREIDGAFYAFDTEGYMLTGWQKLFSKQYYFSPDSGAQVRGWMQLEDKWYYLDPYDGHLHLGGPEKIDGKLYYFRWDNGIMRQNEIFCACDSDNGRNEHGRHFYQATKEGPLECNREDRNPNNPYEVVIYDEKGRISAFNKELNRYDLLHCENDEHIKNSNYYRDKIEWAEKGNNSKKQ